MMRLLAAGVIAIGESAVVLLIAKATVIIASAIVAGWLARRRRAAVRHLILAAAFAALALLPVATALIPPVPVRVLAIPASIDAARTTPFNGSVATVMVAAGGPSEALASRLAWPVLSTLTLLPIVWLAGVIGCLVPVVLGLCQIRRIRRDGLPWRAAQMMANDLARHAEFSRPIDVIVHEAVGGPMTCGVVRPAIVFPPDARTWREADVRRALTHELEHVRRRDWVTLCLARLMCAVYWFHPLVWVANRQLCVDAERACDDAVLRESHAFGYADQLVTLAERALTQTRRPVLAMAGRGDLCTRVHAVLNSGQPRGPAGVWVRMTVTMAVVVSVALLAPVRTVSGALEPAPADRRAQTPAERTSRPHFEVVSIKPAPRNSIMDVRPLSGRLTADATLQVLMQYAYGVQSFQVVGGPSWLTSTQYAVDAKADTTANRDQLFVMLRALLEDRFQLKTHRDVKDLPAFALVASQGEPALPAPSAGACVESAPDAAVEWAGVATWRFREDGPAATRECGAAVVALTLRGAELRGRKIAMSELVRMLSMLLGRRVLDKTGSTALFSVQLNFVPDETTPGIPALPPGSGFSGVSIAQSLEQQLGLRLEPTHSPVDVLVVDQAERPAAN